MTNNNKSPYKLIEWFLRVISDPDNPLGLTRQLSASEIYSAFGVDDDEGLLESIKDVGTKRKSTKLRQFFCALGIYPYDLAVSAIKALNKSALYCNEYHAIEVWLRNNDFCNQQIADILVNYHMDLVIGDDHLTKEKYHLQKYIIGSLNKCQLTNLLNDSDTEIPNHIKIHVINTAIRRKCYTFKASDIDAFLEASSTFDIGDSYPFIVSEDKANPIFLSMLDALKKGEVSLSNLRDVLLEPEYRSFSNLFAKFFEFREVEELHACLALENIPNSNDDAFGYAPYWGFEDLSGMVDKNPLRYLEYYGEDQVNAIKLTYAAKQYITEGLEESAKTARVCLDSIVGEMSKREVEVASDLSKIEKFVNGRGTRADLNMNHVGYALLAKMMSSMKNSLLTFKDRVANQRWFNYENISFDDIIFLGERNVTEIRYSDIYEFYCDVLKLALNNKAYFYILTQSLSIQDISRCLYDLPELYDTLMAAAKAISDNELSALPDRYKMSAMYIALRSDLELAYKIANSITSYCEVPFLQRLLSKDGDDKKINFEDVQKQISLMPKVLKQNIDSIPRELFSLQKDVIGRVQRDIRKDEVAVTLAIGLCITAGVVDYRSALHQVKINKSFDDRYGAYNSYHYHGDILLSIVKKRLFPRLRNDNASEKLEIIVEFLKSIGITHEHISSDENVIEEDGIIVGSKAYIFGEFSWRTIFEAALARNIDSLVFLTADCVAGDSKENLNCFTKHYKVTEYSVDLNKENLKTITFTLDAIDRENLVMNMFEEELYSSQLICVLNHYLPAISHQGILVNSTKAASSY